MLGGVPTLLACTGSALRGQPRYLLWMLVPRLGWFIRPCPHWLLRLLAPLLSLPFLSLSLVDPGVLDILLAALPCTLVP